MLSILAAALSIATSAPSDLAPTAVARANYAGAIERGREVIGEQMRTHALPGLSVALVAGQRIVWAQGFGQARREEGRAAGPDTVYALGSATSLITAFAAMQLAERGALDIDRPVRRYLPDFSVKTRFADAPPLTPRHIMMHHSGLPAFLLHGKWSRAPAPFQSVREVLGDHYMVTPPNYTFARSDAAYDVLGCVLEAVSGRHFVSLLEDDILHPLKMDSSGFRLDARLRSRLAAGYRAGDRRPALLARDVPATGLYTTVEDLGRFVQMIFAGGQLDGRRLAAPATVAETLRPQNTSAPMTLDAYFGLGWALGGFEVAGETEVAHFTGDALYHRTQIVILPRRQLGVVVMTNAAEGREAVDIVAREVLSAARRDQSALPIVEAVHRPPPAGIRRVAAADEFRGDYATWRGLMRVYEAGGELRLDVGSRSVFLVPRAGGRYAMEYRLFGLWPIHIARLDHILLSPAVVDGIPVMVANFRGSDFVFGQRLTPGPIPQAWRDRTGRYRVVRQDEVYTLEDPRLEYEDGLLRVSYRIPALSDETLVFPIKPLSDREAVVQGIGGGLGATLRVDADDKTISLMGYRVRPR